MTNVIFLLMALPFIGLTIFMLMLNACTGFQGVADDVEKIADNDGVIIKVEKDAFQEDTDVKINIDILNKELPPLPPRFLDNGRA